jgi:hypothetical protein
MGNETLSLKCSCPRFLETGMGVVGSGTLRSFGWKSAMTTRFRNLTIESEDIVH